MNHSKQHFFLKIVDDLLKSFDKLCVSLSKMNIEMIKIKEEMTFMIEFESIKLIVTCVRLVDKSILRGKKVKIID